MSTHAYRVPFSLHSSSCSFDDLVLFHWPLSRVRAPSRRPLQNRSTGDPLPIWGGCTSPDCSGRPLSQREATEQHYLFVEKLASRAALLFPAMLQHFSLEPIVNLRKNGSSSGNKSKD